MANRPTKKIYAANNFSLGSAKKFKGPICFFWVTLIGRHCARQLLTICLCSINFWASPHSIVERCVACLAKKPYVLRMVPCIIFIILCTRLRYSIRNLDHQSSKVNKTANSLVPEDTAIFFFFLVISDDICVRCYLVTLPSQHVANKWTFVGLWHNLWLWRGR